MGKRKKSYKVIHKVRGPRETFKISSSLGDLQFGIADFIKAIGTKPVLFSLCHDRSRFHLIRPRQIAAWLEIGKSLNPTFGNLAESEQLLLAKELRIRWSIQKAMLRRANRMKEVGDPKYKPYIFRKEIDFYVKSKGIDSDEDPGNDIETEQNVSLPEVAKKYLQKRKQRNDVCVKSEELTNNSPEPSNKSKKPKMSNPPSTPYSPIQLRQRKSDANVSLDRKSSNISERLLQRKSLANVTPTRKSTRGSEMLQQKESDANITSDRNLTNNSEVLPGRESDGSFTSPRKSTEKSKNTTAEEADVNDCDVGNSIIDPMFFCETIGIDSVDPEDFEQQEHAQHDHSDNTQGTPITNSRHSNALQIQSVFSAIEDNADQAFFESIKPSLRKMDETQKLDFKIEVLQLLKKYQN